MRAARFILFALVALFADRIAAGSPLKVCEFVFHDSRPPV